MLSLARVRRSTLPCLLLLLPLGCTHSDPYANENYGAIGPRSPGPEARLADAEDASWSENGGGILYSGSCLTRTAVLHASIPSIIVLPAGGGSAILDLCEQPLTLSPPTALDSAVTLLSPALGADGRLIYVEVISNNTEKPLPCTCIPFPIATHAELWLGDSASPFSRRRKLLTLYHDAVGRPTVPDTEVNWLLEAVWTGENTFVALGENLRPSEVGRTAGPLLGIVRGIIAAGTATLSRITGTDRAQMFSMAESNGTVVFNRDSLALERVPIAGGTAVIAAVIPPLPGRTLQDISCKAELCLVVTEEPGGAGGGQSTLWTLTLNTGVLASLRVLPTPVSRARLSPTSNAVLVVESGGLYLFTDLFH